MVKIRWRYFEEEVYDNEQTEKLFKRTGAEDRRHGIIKEIENGLASRELVKVKIQEGCLLKPKETALEVAPQLKAEFVQAIGRKFILYRKSKDNQQIVLPAR